jgi:hypothetical protein
MANRSERLRKAYEFKLGKDVASKLSDEQIVLISSYYKSLSKDEQSQIDIDIFMGKTNDLSEMASSFIEENEEPPVKKAKVTATATKEKPKGGLVFAGTGKSGKGGEDLVDEKIDERILRIIGLEDVFDIDYDTYISLLKEQSVLISTGKSKIPREEEILIQDEFKRVKKRKGTGRFKVSKITAESFKKGTAVGLNLQKLSGEVKSPPLMLSPAMESVEKISEIVEIKDALKEIIGYLTQQNKDVKKKADLDRKSAENKKRAEKESALEKGSGKVMKIAEKILAPVKSLLQRIIDFITAVFFGRALIKLIDWLANPENKTKIDSILRFLGDHWPALLALYLRFGTGLGKFVGAISNIVIKGGIRLSALALQLLAKAGVGKAAGAAKFLGGRGGRLLGAGLQLAATVGSTQALSSGIENFGGIGGEKQEPPKVEGRVGGGAIKIPKFAGGGFNFGGIGNFFSGLVSGKKGVDKIPAMLSDGEFVMSAGAVRKHGVSTLEAMNAAGGGTNKPKMIAGATYAAGGGLIGDIPLSTAYGANPNNNTLRQAARMFSQQGRFGTEKDLFKTFKKIGGVADFEKMVGGKQNFQGIQQGMHNADNALDAIRKSAIEKLKGVNKLQSSTKIGSALDNTNSALDDLIKSNKRGLRDTRFKLGLRTAPENRMLPAAGESSANAMRAAQRAAQNVRSPIPASRAIVPYAGGRLATQPMQQITTNMKVPGGRGGGGLTSAILMSLLEIFKPQIQSAVGSLYNSMGIGIGNLSDAKLKKQIEEELKMQKNINSMGIVGEDINGQSDRLSLLQQEANRRNIKGGAIKGGYGLKDESFKDAPKTQIMSDDKGRFFVGYKAMRNGKIQYVRGPEPGTGSSNPLEMLGRAINPNAYKQVDAISAKNKYQEASAGSISSLKARGASQLTLANRQSELKRYAPSAPSRPTPRVVYRQGAGTGGARTKSDLMGGATPKVPAFSASHSSGHSRSAKMLGIK